MEVRYYDLFLDKLSMRFSRFITSESLLHKVQNTFIRQIVIKTFIQCVSSEITFACF